MNDKRPMYLNLFTMKYPIPSIASILHRISGVILFFLIPFFIFLLDKSLHSQADFTRLQECLAWPWVKFLLWVSISALIYHFIAGFRHIWMDFGFAESLQGGRACAVITLILSIILIILTGVWLW